MKTKFIATIGLAAFLGFNNQTAAQARKGYITAMAADRSGKYLVTAGADGKVNIWDIEKSTIQKEIWFYGQSYLDAVAISPDNKFIAIAVGGGGTSVYSFPDGKIVTKFKDAGSRNLIYLPNGNLATINYDGNVQIWDAPNDKLLREFKPGKTIYCPMAVSANGKLLIAAAPKDRFKIYDLSAAGEDEIFKERAETTPKALAFSHDAKMFAVAGNFGENAVTIYDAETKAVLRTIKSESSDNRIVFSADNESVYISGYKTVEVIHIKSGERKALPVTHFAKINEIVLSDDGKSLMSGGDDLSAVVYDIPKNWLKRRFLHQDPEPKELEHGVGAKFGGGIVVDSYRAGDGQEHGLIMSLTDLPEVVWCDQTGFTGAKSSDGFGNTEAIIRSQSTHAHAAGLSRELQDGSFTDWYLPSTDECTRIIKNIGFTKWPFVYWTSTELSEDKAYGFDFRTGLTVPQKKSKGGKIRAVRAF